MLERNIFPRRHSFRTAGRAVRLALAAAIGLMAHGRDVARAATPAVGTLTPLNTTVTWTGSVFGANADETTCQDGTTCDVFTLTLAPGDYTGQRISLGISWLLPASDYDLYVHSGSVTGPVVSQSADGAPATTEQCSIPIDPPVVTTARVYVAHVVCFTVPPATTYSGTAALVNAPATRQPVYAQGFLRFSQNTTVVAPATTTDNEPSIRCDVRGNCYVGGIRGVPAGVDLWRFNLDPNSPGFDPGLQNPTYLGQPDAFLPQDPNDPMAGGADGGGDIDIAVNFPAAVTDTPIVTIISLAAAEISSAVSTDRGAHFTLSPAVAALASDDRQWLEADGPNTLYMLYRAPVPATGLFVQRSDDHGLTYPVTGLVSPSGTTPGYIDVDHTTHRVYVAHSSSSALTVGYSTDQGLTWHNSTVDNTTNHGSLFDVVKVGDDGTVYALWSDETNIYLAHSTDGGNNWSEKVRVNDNSAYKSNLFPWLEAGSAGRVGVVWLGSTDPVNDDNADWQVLFAQTTDATAQNPTFRQQVISDHVVHGSNISLGGLTGGANRNLGDYFQVALDPQGAAVVSWGDDHNDFNGNIYVTRQLDGPGLYANANGNGQVTPAFPPSISPPSGPEVGDFLHDAVAGLLVPIATDNPFDILWIDYSCSAGASGDTLIATMKLSGLTTVPPGGIWRVNFTANTPAPGGLSDRGDQFYLQVSSQNPATPAFTFGTSVRGGDGVIVNTSRGSCLGVMDTTNSVIRFRVTTAQLNPFVTHGGPILPGSVLYGLRGSAATTGANAISDNTRGGSYFAMCGPISGAPVPDPTRRVASLLGAPNPNPFRSHSSIQFRVERTGFVELGIFDVTGRRVRTLSAGTLAPGTYERSWDGRTDRFSDAPGGIYFLVLNTAGRLETQRIVLAR